MNTLVNVLAGYLFFLRQIAVSVGEKNTTMTGNIFYKNKSKIASFLRVTPIFFKIEPFFFKSSRFFTTSSFLIVTYFF